MTGWLLRASALTGPPFWRYLVVDMENKLELEIGVGLRARSRVTAGQPGVLPAGRFATVVPPGHPETLVTATRDLLQWAGAALRALGGTLDGNRWGCRLEE